MRDRSSGGGPRSARLTRKRSGSHYTPKPLADFLSREITRAVRPGDSPLRVADPAAGDGQLLVSLLTEMRRAEKTVAEAHGFDTDGTALDLARQRLVAAFPSVRLTLSQQDFLDLAPTPFDVVISNPPYVRTQVLGASRARSLAGRFGFSGRVDLYFAFLEGIASVLRPGGVAGIIVSNRFMTTQAGATIRRRIREAFDILHVWDLGDTRLFEAAVLPAVLLLRRKGLESARQTTRYTAVYSTNDAAASSISPDVFSALSRDGIVRIDARTFLVEQGELATGDAASAVWRLATDAHDQWLRRVRAHTHRTFGDLGAVRVGVKTTADAVFIRDDWERLPEADRPELLKPLVTHHAAQRFRAREVDSSRWIVYPYASTNGRRVVLPLEDFPRTARYLAQHRAVLEARPYVRDSGRLWFEIWVPQDPDAWPRPKLVFRDIAEAPTFWMDPGGSVVNGDCYWLAPGPSTDLDDLWLALAVGNSTFIAGFYDRLFRNRLYAGRRRFMTQYVSHFPLPAPDGREARELVELATRRYAERSLDVCASLEQRIDDLVWSAFGLASPGTSR